MQFAIGKIDPKKRADVGGYRMDSAGESLRRTVRYSKSETYLTELMESICMELRLLTTLPAIINVAYNIHR